MSLLNTTTANDELPSSQGPKRRQLLGRGTLFIFIPAALPALYVIVQHFVALLFPGVATIPSGPEPRASEVWNDWLLVAYGIVGIVCEYLGLNYFGKLEKKFSPINAAAFLIGVFSLILLSIFFVLFVVGAVDLIWPGARIYS